MTSFRICLLTSLVALLLSCNKEWFEKKSDKSLTVLSSIQEFEMLLEDMSNQTPALGEMASDGHYPDSFYYLSLLSSPDPGSYAQTNAYTWSLEFPYTNVEDWQYGYKRIFICNLALDGLKKIQPSNANEKEKYENVKGNALFHRAKNYYDLCQLYALPFDANSNNDGMGIPLKEGIDITATSFRSSVSQCYDRIISDLTEAATLLPPRAPYSTRGSRSASYALLARTYLTMQNYDKAAEYADLCLGIYHDLLNFNDLPIDNSIIGGRLNKEVLFYSEMFTYAFLFNPYFFIDSSLYNNFSLKDLRRSRFFSENSDGSISFKGNYTDLPYFQFSGLATDEVYLIRAECYARSGDVSNALKYLNDLLITRWDNTIPYDPVATTTPEGTLDRILLERRKELLLRGIRWSDLRRLNLDPKTVETLNRSVNGKFFKLMPNSHQYTFPIPKDVLDLAPGIQQTPGWE